MKTIFTLSILFSVIALPALGELTDTDLNQIRLIVREEIDAQLKPIKADIVTLKIDVAWLRGKNESIDKQFESVDKQFASVGKQFEGIYKQFDSVNQRITHATNVSYGLIALIVSAIAIPQVIVAWRSRKDRAVEKQLETLTQEIEALKRQKIVGP